MGVLRSAGLSRAIPFDLVSLVNRLVTQLRQHSSDLHIFVRARDMKHLRKLQSDGATAIVPESAETSLQLGAIMLRYLGINSETSTNIVDNYRQNDYALPEDLTEQVKK